MYDLVTVMLVDGHVDERELELCKFFVMKLGFRTAIVNKLIKDLLEQALLGVAKDMGLINA